MKAKRIEKSGEKRSVPINQNQGKIAKLEEA